MSTSNVKVTAKEIDLLNRIVNSEYQDGLNPVGHDIWLDYVVDSKSRGGVLSSLIKKGFVKIRIIDMDVSDNREAGITDSTVSLTASGAEALKERAS